MEITVFFECLFVRVQCTYNGKFQILIVIQKLTFLVGTFESLLRVLYDSRPSHLLTRISQKKWVSPTFCCVVPVVVVVFVLLFDTQDSDTQKFKHSNTYHTSIELAIPTKNCKDLKPRYNHHISFLREIMTFI